MGRGLLPLGRPSPGRRAGWLDAALRLVFPGSVAAALVLVAWVALTGALHLDGFLDACDGLLGGGTPEERLRIMRDERVGAFALAGGILLLLVKYSALAAVPGAPPHWCLPALWALGDDAAVVIFPVCARRRGWAGT